MKNLCFILAALSSSVALAADMPEAKSGVQPAQVQSLHRHPTLLAMLRRSNLIRRNVGLRPQRINPALTKAAQDHANYMASTGDFSHYTNGGYQYRAQK
ncbi:MAG: CAP domain-containing protein [Pirellulaceae bacterium]|nr:CAP domain-containing protein [Pirellulaceae bacterium]